MDTGKSSVKKILVLYVPAGAGHQKAAEAVAIALSQRKSECAVTLMDALNRMPPRFSWSFKSGYLGMIQNFPWAWGLAYYGTDIRFLSRLSQWVHRLVNSLQGKWLEEIILEQKPDVIVSTHFFPADVAAYIKKKENLNLRAVTVVTDYLPHSIWIAENTDLYCAGSETTRKDLVERGVPNEKIVITGIPVDPKFAVALDRTATAKTLGISPEKFTLLICSGGFGTGPVKSLVESLRQVPERMQVLIVAGKNPELRRDLEALKPSIPHDLTVYGFVDNIDELMSVSDLLITKPGGLSCSEALAKQLPMILVFPIPGQEEHNAQVLEKAGTALRTNQVNELPGLIRRIRTEPAFRQQLIENGKTLRRPDAAEQIARLVLSS